MKSEKKEKGMLKIGLFTQADNNKQEKTQFKGLPFPFKPIKSKTVSCQLSLLKSQLAKMA